MSDLTRSARVNAELDGRWMRWAVAIALLAAVGAASAPAAAQEDAYLEALQPSSGVGQTEIGDCIPRPISGTVPYLNTFNAKETNAQIFGTVGFFERVMLRPSSLGAALAVDLDELGEFEEGDDEEPPLPFWAWEINVINNVVRVPVVNLGSGCGRDVRYGMQSMDLYAANSALRIPLLEFTLAGERSTVSVFYAGGVTANLIENTNPVFQTYRFAGIGLLGTYMPPAVLAFEDDGGFQQISGDFIVGARGDFGDFGDLYLGYVWSQGIYTNLSIPKLKAFASALIESEETDVPLLEAGLKAIKLVDSLGKSSLWGRRQELALGSQVATGAEPLRLTTGNFSQEDIRLGDVFLLDLYGSYAFEPEPFLHKVGGAIHVAGLYRFVRLSVGTIDFPDQPHLAVTGGRRWSVVSDLGPFRVGYNDPDLFDAFPYARDFYNVNVKLAF